MTANLASTRRTTPRIDIFKIPPIFLSIVKIFAMPRACSRVARAIGNTALDIFRLAQKHRENNFRLLDDESLLRKSETSVKQIFLDQFTIMCGLRTSSL